jgi:hypothetical protein
MVQSIYGHLGSHIAPRGEHVEFRLEQFDSPQFAVRMAEIARISAERNEKKPQKKKLPIEVELAAVQIALEMGDSGPRPAATELRARGGRSPRRACGSSGSATVLTRLSGGGRLRWTVGCAG